MIKNHFVRPWAWVPTLYLGESLPFSAVMLISVIMFKDFGLTDGQITVYTGWLGLPWVIKPLWSPFVDNFKTKRWWILSMQFLMGLALAAVAFTIPTAYWLQCSLAIFMLIAFASATHDVSADGFYIIGLNNREQELYVGVRNTFYRIGMMLGQGGMVTLQAVIALSLTSSVHDDNSQNSLAWAIIFVIMALLMLALGLFHSIALPKVEQPLHDRFVLKTQLVEFWNTLKVFARKPHIITALLFILLFRLPEGLLTKIVPLFLTRSVAEGGLEMTKVDFGLVYGTLGVIGLLAGGIIGGWAVSKWGLKRCLWPLVACTASLPSMRGPSSSSRWRNVQT